MFAIFCWSCRAAASCARPFFTDEAAQDLVEYAFLAAFVGIAGWAVLMIIPETIGTTYASWIDADNGVPALWDPPEPASAGS